MTPSPRRPPRPRPDRREFLRRAALLAGGMPALAILLDGCASGSDGEEPDWPDDLKIATPDSPVLWDITAGNEPVPDGLGPENGATLSVYTYADYISAGAVRSFEDTYGIPVRVSTFNNTDEALRKIRGGGVDFDLYTPSYDQIGRLAGGGLLRPLNHSYIPNIANVWPTFADPWYDRQWRYSVPYAVYTTGIGWRTDLIPADIGALPNPFAALWDPAYRSQTAVIDDAHTAMSMTLLKLGITDVNTSSPDHLEKVREALGELRRNTAPAITVMMFSELAAGLFGLSQMWSDDVLSVANYLPEGVGPEILRYWFPADGRGLVDNDLMVIPRGGRNPVAAHLFINHMLDPKVARANFAAVGSQPPQVSLDANSLVADGIVPENLRSAIVRPDYFDTGYRILELEPANEEAWQRIWRDFKTQQS